MTNPAGGPPPPGEPPGSVTPPPPTTAAAGAYAEWWKRVVSALIDGAILWIVQLILSSVLGLGVQQQVTVDPTTGQITGGGNFLVAALAANVVLAIAGVLYFILLNGSEKGQTVGKMVMKLSVRDEATGGRAGYGKAFIRYLVGAVLFALCFVPGVVDVLFPLWDDKRQTLHDKAAKTVVVDLGG